MIRQHLDSLDIRQGIEERPRAPKHLRIIRIVRHEHALPHDIALHEDAGNALLPVRIVDTELHAALVNDVDGIAGIPDVEDVGPLRQLQAHRAAQEFPHLVGRHAREKIHRLEAVPPAVLAGSRCGASHFVSP